MTALTLDVKRWMWWPSTLFTRHDDAEARRIGTNSNPPSPAGDPPEPANTRSGSPASMPSAPGVAG